MSKETTKSSSTSSSDPSQRAASAATAAPPSPPRKSPPKAVPPAAEKTPRKRPAPKPSTPVEPVRNQITSGTLRVSKHILQLARLFGRFFATITNSRWRNLEFFWKFLEFVQKNRKFFQNSLNLTTFKLENLSLGKFLCKIYQLQDFFEQKVSF